MKLKIFLLILLLCAGLVAWAGFEAHKFLVRPASDKASEILFTVNKGGSLGQISQNLQSAGLVSSARNFSILAYLRGKQKALKAGRFLLNKSWTPDQVLYALTEGKPALDRITIPEGLTWWQTAQLLDENGFARFDDFKEAIFDPQFLRHYGIPFSSAEGFLMPDTYLLKKPDTGDGLPEPDWKSQSRKVAGRLIDNFWQKAGAVWPEKDGNRQKPDAAQLKKLAILASIVEKETAVPAERPRVAGVYQNRLDRKMLLQADPTVIYGLGSAFSGPLLRRHLEDDSNPYNTYKLPGLPPGPIASFGISALKAAINPEQHKYLYFVAKKNGGEHNFSETLTEHNEAVRQYRQQK